MSRLHDLQRDFSHAVWHGHASTMAGIVANGIDPEQRLAIYRNNTRLGLTEALRDVYPVISRLVGDIYFDWLARNFMDSHRPKTACLLTFGRPFPEFLENFRGLGQLPYLADTARLEWLWHEAFHAADGTGIDVSDLAGVPASAYGELRFHLHPAVRLMTSVYPVLRIWQLNQTESHDEGRVDLNEGGCYLLVFRSGLDVEVMSLERDQYRFLAGLKSGLTLSEAVAQILVETPAFDVSAALRLCLNQALLTDFFLA